MKKYHLEAIFHEPNSRFAYAFDGNTLHIRLQTKRDDVARVDLVWNDPFLWNFVSDGLENTKEYYWQHQTSPMKLEFQTEYSDYWFIELQCPTKRYKYAFLLDETLLVGSQSAVPYDEIKQNAIHNYYNFPYTNEADITKAPDWVHSMTWYQIFVDRFFSENPLLDWESPQVDNKMIFGGNLKGIIQKLDYLQELGVKGIYLNPIFESPSAHKYDTIDYYQVDPTFGTNKDLKQLVVELHKRGMRIMLDGVFNHCGFHHPYWQDVLKNEEKSPYYEYFIVKQKPILDTKVVNGFAVDQGSLPNYETFAFTRNMPKWNTNNPVVRAYLKQIAVHYVKEYDIDGWRWDVSEEPAHILWTEINQAIEAIKPDFYHIGENWYDANAWLSNKQFHGVMNYPLQFAILEYFQDKIDGASFVEKINKVLWMYPKNLQMNMYNLLDCHDTVRAKTLLQQNLKLAYLFLFSFAGSPSLYYGSEIGMEGNQDPDNRRPMTWGNIDQDLKTFVQKCIQLRAYPSVTSVDIRWIQNDDFLIYEKGTAGKTIFIISKKQTTVQIPAQYQGMEVYDYFNETTIILHETYELNDGYAVFMENYEKRDLK